MFLSQGGPNEQKDERGAPPLKRRYFTGIGSSNVKMVADRQDTLLTITSTGDELLRNVNINDLE